MQEVIRYVGLDMVEYKTKRECELADIDHDFEIWVLNHELCEGDHDGGFHKILRQWLWDHKPAILTFYKNREEVEINL